MRNIKQITLCFPSWRILTLSIIMLTSQLRLMPHDSPALPLHHPQLELHLDDIKSQFAETSLLGDASWYIGIAKNGYEKRPFSADRQANWAFFPLLPVLLRLLTRLTGSYLISGLLISHACFFLSLWVLANFLQKENLSDEKIQRALWLFVLFPTSYFFGAPLTESLFAFLVLGAFWFAQRRQAYLGAVMLCLAGTCRPTGVMLLPAYLAYLWHQSPTLDRRLIISAIVVPLGLAAFMYHLWSITGDPLAYAHIQKTWGRESFSPQKFFTTYLSEPTLLVSDWNFQLLNFLSGLLGLFASISFLRQKHLPWALLISVPTLTAILTGSTMSMTRFISVLFPLYIFLAQKLDTPNKERIWLAASVGVLALLCVMYALHITAAMS